MKASEATKIGVKARGKDTEIDWYLEQIKKTAEQGWSWVVVPMGTRVQGDKLQALGYYYPAIDDETDRTDHPKWRIEWELKEKQ